MGPEVVMVVGALVLALVSGWVLSRRARAERGRLAAELASARVQVAALDQRLEQLTAEVGQARRLAERDRERDREYVITTLAEIERAEAPPHLPSPPAPRRPSPSRLLEEQVVDVLARQRELSGLRSRAVDAVVKAVAAGHGVRRALSPDNLDRAAAEAHVARRRSRRNRRRELREARRLLREVRTRRPAAEDAA